MKTYNQYLTEGSAAKVKQLQQKLKKLQNKYDQVFKTPMNPWVKDDGKDAKLLKIEDAIEAVEDALNDLTV